MKEYLRKITRQETYLGKNKKTYYFEGWYYKFITQDKQNTIAIIFGVTKGVDAHSFIQVIDNIKNKAYYFRYKLEDFSFCNKPFYIKIGDNSFSLTSITLNIRNINLKGKLKFDRVLPISKNIYSPNIMGPFAYLLFMECNHSVISLGHLVSGELSIYDKKINFNQGIGYIEKDYGISFPKRYIWLQANGDSPDTNIFISIATIPFKVFTFNGLIGIIMVNGKEYRFATYLGAKLISSEKIDKDKYLIKIKQGFYYLEIEVENGVGITLVSPNKGLMQEQVRESLNSKVSIRLMKSNKVLLENTFFPCTTEVLW